MSVASPVEVKVLQETWLVEIETPIAWDERVIFRVNHLFEFTPLTQMAETRLQDPAFVDMITIALKNHMTRDGTSFIVTA